MTNPTPRDDFWEVLSDGKSQPVPRPVITVLGAGITGLTIAHECAERGFIVQVIEAQQAPGDAGGVAVGGIAKTQYAVANKDERFTRPPAPHLPRLTLESGPGRGAPPAYSGPQVDRRGVRNDEKIPVIAERLLRLARSRAVFDGEASQVAVEIVAWHGDRALAAADRAALAAAAEKVAEELRAALDASRTASERADPSPRFTFKSKVEKPGARSGDPAPVPTSGIEVRVAVPEGAVSLPGDHGYRFFPAFYRHVFDTMRRTAAFDGGEATPRTTFDNLVPTLDISVARENGRATHDIVKKRARSLEDVRSLFESVGTGLGWSVKDMVRYGFFVFKYVTSCAERRTEYETGRYEERLRNDLGLPRVNPTRTWFDFIMGRSDLGKGYPYAEDFLKHLRSTSQALIAMSEQEVDIQTFGNVQMQLLLDHVRAGDDTDMTLNGPTTEAWLVHWKKYLQGLGVRFFPGKVTGLMLDGHGELYPVVTDSDSGAELELAPDAEDETAVQRRRPEEGDRSVERATWLDESGVHRFVVPRAATDEDALPHGVASSRNRSAYWVSALALDELWLLLGSVSTRGSALPDARKAAAEVGYAELISKITIQHMTDGQYEVTVPELPKDTASSSAASGSEPFASGGGGTEPAGGERPGSTRSPTDESPPINMVLVYSASPGPGASVSPGELVVQRLVPGRKIRLDSFPGHADFDLHRVTVEGEPWAVFCESGMFDRKADFQVAGLEVETIDSRVFGFLFSKGPRRKYELYDATIAGMCPGLGPTFRQLNRWRLRTEVESGKKWRGVEKPAGHFLRGSTFRDFSGLQYFWDFDFKFNQGHSYFPDSEFGLSSISQPQFWKHVSYRGYRSIVSFDLGNLYRGHRTSLALADRYRANPKTRAVPHPDSVWNSTREELDLRVWDQMKRGMRENFADRLPRAQHVHIDDFIEYGERDGRILPRRNLAPFLINAPGQWQRDRPSRTGYGPTMIGDPSDTGAWYLLPQTLDWYEINNRRWVVAGPHMKTFTRMTTMEAANESARHAVNRILHHMGFELDRNDRVRPGFGTSGLFVGDFCPIWNMVDHELPDLEGFKRIDKRLLEGGLPHFMDILDLEPQMEAILASMEMADGAVDMAKAIGSIVGQLGKLKLPKGGGVLAERAGKQLEKDWHVPNLLGLFGRFFDPAAISNAATQGSRGIARELLKAVRKVDPETRSSGELVKIAEAILGNLAGGE